MAVLFQNGPKQAFVHCAAKVCHRRLDQGGVACPTWPGIGELPGARSGFAHQFLQDRAVADGDGAVAACHRTDLDQA